MQLHVSFKREPERDSTPHIHRRRPCEDGADREPRGRKPRNANGHQNLEEARNGFPPMASGGSVMLLTA